LSNFFQSKTDTKTDTRTSNVTEMAKPTMTTTKSTAATDSISTLGAAMQITGNITCAGMVQIYGRVNGDIHATGLMVCDGATVEGTIVAQDTVIQGKFRGTLHSNNVKMTRTAMVDGEIYSKSLTIEQDAQFEGMSRKLDKPVEAVGTKSAAVAAAVAAPTAATAPQATPTATLNGMQKPHVVN
jgi:cytoskeletal protein CcmA (bactofilin family)